MIESNMEFMTLSREEKAEVIYEMVKDLMIETGYPLPICIAIVAEYKHWSIFQVEQYIKIHDEQFYYTIAFYEDGQPVYRAQLDNRLKQIIEKYLYEPILAHPFEVTSSWIRKVIADYFEAIEWNTLNLGVNND